jgi:dTMP kinase
MEYTILSDAPSSVFIAIEGIDGAGKTTQVRMLRSALERVGIMPVVSKEPTNGQWGRIIKDSAVSGRLSPNAELDAFVKDRAEHVETIIAPALRLNEIVILDRYFYSSIAYQGSRGANVDEVKGLMESMFPIPDAVFILDIDPMLSVHRIAHSRGEEPNHFEDRGNLAKAREIFLSMSGPNIHHVEGANARSAIHKVLIETLVEKTLKRKWCSKAYGCDDPFHCASRILGTCKWAALGKKIIPVPEEKLADQLF